MNIERLRFERDRYRQDSDKLATLLLGQRLVRVLDGQRLAGRIVEVEAYLGIPDRAAHTFGGRRTERNASMWLDGGHAYVYFTYGMHHCVNVVAGIECEPVAVLIRALEPLEGLDLMKEHRLHRRRKKQPTGHQIIADTELCSGPAKLCQALAIDRHLDGIDLTISDTLFIETDTKQKLPAKSIQTGPRIGVDYAGDWADKPLRFYMKANPHVSRPR